MVETKVYRFPKQNKKPKKKKSFSISFSIYIVLSQGNGRHVGRGDARSKLDPAQQRLLHPGELSRRGPVELVPSHPAGEMRVLRSGRRRRGRTKWRRRQLPARRAGERRFVEGLLLRNDQLVRHLRQWWTGDRLQSLVLPASGRLETLGRGCFFQRSPSFVFISIEIGEHRSVKHAIILLLWEVKLVMVNSRCGNLGCAPGRMTRSTRVSTKCLGLGT